MPTTESQHSTPTSERRLDITTSPRTLIRIARQLQFAQNEAETEVHILCRKLADVTNHNNSNDSEDESPQPKRQCLAGGHSEVTSEEVQIMNAGRLFVILYGPWLVLGKRTFAVEYDHLPRDERERFKTDENKAKGQLEEIAKVLGDDWFCEASASDWIAKAFMKGMKSQVSNTSTRLRHYCASLLGVAEIDLLQPEDRKTKFRHLIGWVDDGLGGSYSSVDVEILHKGYAGKFDLSTAFLNPILMRVFVAIIRGPSTAKELMKGVASTPKAETMASKHGIRQITPGAIASSVVLTRWALSADVNLQPVGANTGINYLGDFEQYLELLMRGLRLKQKSILNIFREWNHQIFPNSDPAYPGDSSTSDTSGFKEAFAMVDADEEQN